MANREITIEYIYDETGRLMKRRAYSFKYILYEECFEYDEKGNIITIRNSNGTVRINRIYDENNRLVEDTCCNIVTKYSYDENGRCVRQVNDYIDTTFEYDEYNNVSCHINNITGVRHPVKNKYDDSNRLICTEMIDPFGMQNEKTITRYIYDEIGRIECVIKSMEEIIYES